jgi:hypothetical protein
MNTSYGPAQATKPAVAPAPARGLLQRQCACGNHASSGECEECRKQKSAGVLQRAAMNPGSPGEAPPIVHEVLRSPGQPLGAATRAFMEPRFQRDFSQVRVHTDARAAESARAVSAHAYTVGRDVVFATGKFSPQTSGGRRLLAHELAHTSQLPGAGPTVSLSIGSVDSPEEREAEKVAEQIDAPVALSELSRLSNSPAMLRRAWNACGATDTCPPRVAGERERAARATLQAGELVDPVPGFIVWDFPIGSSAVGSLAGNNIWSAFDAQVARGSDGWTVQGFSDCEGGIERNTALRTARANAAHGALSSAAQAKVTSVGGASLTDCVAANDTETNRGFNRSAVFERTQLNFEGQQVQSMGCPPRTGAAATSLADYVALVRCAESRTGFNPRQMLAMLRQLYYGKPWSFTSRTSNWDNVIPCSLDLGDPAARLGQNLFQALGNSAEVGGVDMGHIFTGLEAMVCPRRTVDFYIGLATVSTPNEDFATWAGDLGAAVAATLACPLIGAGAASRSDCGRRAGRQPLTFYLAEHAPPQDLEGDIDPYVIRASEAGIACATSGLRPFVPSRPISDILGDYYYDSSTTLGAARGNRNHCFLELIGATFDANGRVNNRRAITTGPMRARVLDFARAFYTNIAGIPSTPNNTELRVMEIYAENALDWFVTILETRAPVTP